jgi:hypothetical protein
MRIGVRLVLHEAQVCARVAAAAGLDQVGLVHRRARIRCGIDLVCTVAIPATRRFHVAAE